MVLRAAVLAALAALPAQAQVYSFCWLGSGGYSMTGRMEVTAGPRMISEADVTAFEIVGWRDGVRIGSWDLSQLTPETTWELNFDTSRMSFPVGGLPGGRYQAWNADGTASDCGDPGFGFNAGSNAQDVCLNGVWITDSMVDRDRPFLAVRGERIPDCHAVPQLSGLTGARRSPRS